MQNIKQVSTRLDKSEKAVEKSEHETIVYKKTKVHAIDHDVLRDRRVVAMLKHDPLAEVFRMLRTKVLKKLRENNWNSFGITAPTQGAGKSMVAANLAIAMSMEVNQTVLLVDLDLRNPRLHWYFDLDVQQGLSDYLLNDVPLSDILVNPGFERLVLLPGRGQAIGSSEILSGPKMKQLIEEIKNRYQSRIVIFDLPPVLSTDDVLASMNYFNAALLVIEEGKNKPDEVTKALQMLSDTQLLGTVLNKSETLPDQQGYY
jgi:protein-tyrosine kinase